MTKHTLMLEFESANELIAYLQSPAPSKAKATVTTTDDDAPAKAKPKAKPAPAETDDDAGLVYEDDVRPHVVKLSKVHGRDAALEVVSTFENADGDPCENAKDVQPADWAALVTKVKKAQVRLDKAKAAAEDADD